jgi:hypothetical protein
LKLTGAAKLFYNGCLELHTGVTWDRFEDAFNQRFKDALSDHFHFMQLQAARQKKNESPREFADRCRALAQKVMRKVDDSIAQRIHRENPDRMLLASVVAGFNGVPGKQVRYGKPKILKRHFRNRFRLKKPKIKEDLMKPSVPESTTWYGCYRCHPLGRAQRTASLGAQLTHK